MRLVVFFFLGLTVLFGCSALARRDAERCGKETDAALAVKYCARAIESGRLSKSDLAIALSNRGKAYMSAGDQVDAGPDYDRAIQLDPNNAQAYFNRAKYYEATIVNPADRAIPDYDQVIRLEPNNAQAYFNRGKLYERGEDIDRVIQDYDQVIRLRPNDAVAFRERGNAYLHKDHGDGRRAIQDWAQAIRIDPHDSMTYAIWGAFDESRGNYDHAIQMLDQEMLVSPNSSYDYEERGDAYFHKGNFDHAGQDYGQAIAFEIGPPGSDNFYKRGLAYFFKGDFDRASQDFDRAFGLYHAATADAYRMLLRPDSELAIWLYLAQSRAGQNGGESLSKAAPKLDLNTWPGPVVSMYLGKISLNSMFKAAASPDRETSQSQLCHAHFYLAEYEVIRKRKDEARREFQAAADSCHKISRFYLDAIPVTANAELKRLGRPN